MRAPAIRGLLLALDTSGREGSVAIGEGSPGKGGWTRVVARASLAAEEEHAALLVPRVREALEEAGAAPGELAGIVVGAGPGSFTGVRVAAATAKGMARALRVPLWAFSSLAAAAVGDEGAGPPAAAGKEGAGPPAAVGGGDLVPSPPRLVLFDARGNRVYAAGYRLGGAGLETLLAPCATTVDALLEEELLLPGALLMGEGAWRHRALLEGAGLEVAPPPAGRPTAGGLLALLSLDPGASPLEDPAAWEPDYLREPGAERLGRPR